MIASPIIIMDASSSPNPKWEAKAARPRPAARPASGPIQERFGCAAAAAGAVGACAGLTSGVLFAGAD